VEYQGTEYKLVSSKPIVGLGIITVATVDFEPFPDVANWTDEDWQRNEREGPAYTGFESQVYLNDTLMYGNGPESAGETPEECHAIALLWAPERVRELA
jgi:hypothetical protein